MSPTDPKSRRYSFPAVAAVLALMFLAACAADKEEYVELPVDILYNVAKSNLDSGNFTEAAKGFDEVERQLTYSFGI